MKLPDSNTNKQSSVQGENNVLSPCLPSNFTQWSADNKDHNISTLNGLNTFHGMGIISLSVPFRQSASGIYINKTVLQLKRSNMSSISNIKGSSKFNYNHPDQPALSL